MGPSTFCRAGDGAICAADGWLGGGFGDSTKGAPMAFVVIVATAMLPYLALPLLLVLPPEEEAESCCCPNIGGGGGAGRSGVVSG